MSRYLLPALLTLIVPILAMACGGSGSGDDESAGSSISLEDIRAAASLSDLDPGGERDSTRTDEGIGILLRGPATLQVGQTAQFYIFIYNGSRAFRPEDPFDFGQETGEFITAGLIVLGKLQGGFLTEGRTFFGPGEGNGAPFDVICTAAGKATITFHSEGLSEITSPVSAYSITVDFHFECIADDDPRYVPGYDELTSNALGFSPDSINWVTFEQNGIVLRINQIEPVKLNAGDSVEIYSDFDAKDASDDRDRELRDAKLEFTIGGPIRIDSPPARQSDLYTVDSDHFSGNQAVLWGFRSGTLTCLSEGEGVYSSVLTGTLAKGGTITQTVSGLVDCEEPSSQAEPLAPDITALLADALDFSGAWSRRPRPDGGYVPRPKDEFPLDTELHFDEQLCVVRLGGVGACRVAYWVYGADWFELTRTGEARRSVDDSGREEFVVDYSGVYHHTHSFFSKTELPAELKHNENDTRATWDLSCGPTEFTFDLEGTLSYSPKRFEPIRIQLQGVYRGDVPYTHGENVGLGYSGPIPEGGVLPVNVAFREEIRAERAPENCPLSGSDKAINSAGPFYSATVTPTGAVTGVVRPRVTLPKVSRATVELFLPGDDQALRSTTVDENGAFVFRGLPILRTDDSTEGVSDVFGTNYTIRVSGAETDVDASLASTFGGNTVLFRPKTVIARPFSEHVILLEFSITHFIAVGDRGVLISASPFFHYSLEYWQCGGDFTPLNHTDGFTPAEIVAKCEALNSTFQPEKLGEVELLARMGWEVWAGVNDFSGTGRSWLNQGVWIAEIMYTDTAATELMPIYTGNAADVQAKWETIIGIANSYQWAEQTGFSTGPNFTQWPQSMYKSLQTNSNTFVRYLVKTSGLTMTEMDGIHPGNDTPSQNTETDVLRPLTFYAANTPWIGSATKPEPSRPPP